MTDPTALHVATTGSSLSGLLWTVILAGACGLVLVEAVVLWAARRWRETPRPVAGGRRLLETAWLVTPAVILVSLVAWSQRVLGSDVRNVPADPDLRVHVTGKMFVWEIRHEIPGPDGTVVIDTLNQLHLPVGKVAEIRLDASDVVHSFWIPQFRVKADALPGAPQSVWMQPMETGEFNIVCAELCGNSHYAMRGFVNVETAEAFDSWVAGKTRAGEARLEPDPDEPGSAGRSAPAERVLVPAATGGF